MVTTRVGIPSDGGVVTIAPGALLEVALPENPGTGFRWALGPLPAGAELVEDRVEPGGSALGPGAAGMRVFVVRAGQRATLTANLRREWEAGPARTFSIQVRPA
jgi:predicted secreted protein